MGPTHYLDSVPPSQAHRVADYLTDLIAEGGDGTTIALAPQSVWLLQSRIRIRTHNVEICTRGYPKDATSQAKLYTTGLEESTAIDAHDTHHFKLSHVYVDGKREEFGWLKGGGALLQTGGAGAKHPVIEYCTLTHPRGWSCLHVFDRCQGAVVTGNKVGPAGVHAPEGRWADGLSIACYNGIISNNEIVDATDGGIVLFCAPGTICVGNTIIARERNLLGGINMVDPFPFKMEYANTRVYNNTIKSEGAYVKLGIGVGPTCWTPVHDSQNFGGVVMDNIIGPGRFGYGIAASGCKDFVIVGNRVAHNTVFNGNMSRLPEPLNAPPVPFLKSSEPGWACGTFQDDFVDGKAVWLIGIEDGPSKKMRFDAGQIKVTSDPSTWIRLQDVTLSLRKNGTLVLTRQDGRILWHSCCSDDTMEDPVLTLCPKSGRLTVRDAKRDGSVLWDPCKYLEGTGDADIPDRYKNKMGIRPGLTISGSEPYLSLWTADSDLIWATSYIFERGRREWQPARYIAVPSSQPRWSSDHAVNLTSDDDLPPPTEGGNVIQGPPTFFYFCPHTSHFIIHQGPTPTHYDHADSQLIFRSTLFSDVPRRVKSKEGDESACAFQGGDGNLVIYAHVPASEHEGGGRRRAIWASSTVGMWLELRGGGSEEGAGLTFYGQTRNEVVKRIP